MTHESGYAAIRAGVAVISEFRDGNVPAGHEILRMPKESPAAYPEGVERVRVRMDSAGYQHEVLKFCATGDGDELIRWHYERCGKSEEAHAAMRLLALPGPLKAKRLKAIRFALIDAPARLVEHSRRLYIRLARGNPALEWLVRMRRLIRNLAPCPA